MCGIVFTNNLNIVNNIKKKILAHTSYRGPDLNKFIIKNQLFFGFNYLSITGTYKGSPQPFERNGNVLLFNGEIYNYKSLKNKLLKHNVKFKTNGDTEVLAACLEVYGIKKTHSLIEGMWAFVYYDNDNNKIFISRDRLGIKPLFYSKKNKNYFLSSSIETIKKFFLKKIIINKNLVKNFLKMGSIFNELNTIYKDINIFPAAHYCEIKNNNFELSRYWSLKQKDQFDNKDLNNFKTIFKKNITKHINYNVKTAIPLSAGLDSNFLLSNFKIKKNLICYSLKNFENDNESLLINKNIKRYKNIEHKFIDCKILNSKQEINKFIKTLDYPIRSFQPMYQYLLRKQAKKDKVKIILNGDGADEVFGGYKYGVPYRVSSLLLKKRYSDAELFSKEMEKFVGQSYKKIILLGQKAYKNKITLKNFLINRILKTHIPYWLYIDDFISMKNSIENRVPFLDSKIVDLSFRWKESFFYKNGNNKFLLRNSCNSKLNNLSKKKFHKPGNYSFVYEILSKDLRKILGKISLDKKSQFKSFLKKYERDIKSKNSKNSDMWFRFYLLNKMSEFKKIKYF